MPTLAEQILAWYRMEDCRVDKTRERTHVCNANIVDVCVCRACEGKWDIVRRDNPDEETYTPPMHVPFEMENHRPGCFVPQAQQEIADQISLKEFARQVLDLYLQHQTFPPPKDDYYESHLAICKLCGSSWHIKAEGEFNRPGFKYLDIPAESEYHHPDCLVYKCRGLV